MKKKCRKRGHKNVAIVHTLEFKSKMVVFFSYQVHKSV